MHVYIFTKLPRISSTRHFKHLEYKRMPHGYNTESEEENPTASVELDHSFQLPRHTTLRLFYWLLVPQIDFIK